MGYLHIILSRGIVFAQLFRVMNMKFVSVGLELHVCKASEQFFKQMEAMI